MPNPITLDRMQRELEEMHADMGDGKLRHGEYDQRLARMIQELRQRGLDAEGAAVMERLDQIRAKGTITESVHHHLVRRLELT